MARGKADTVGALLKRLTPPLFLRTVSAANTRALQEPPDGYPRPRSPCCSPASQPASQPLLATQVQYLYNRLEELLRTPLCSVSSQYDGTMPCGAEPCTLPTKRHQRRYAVSPSKNVARRLGCKDVRQADLGARNSD